MSNPTKTSFCNAMTGKRIPRPTEKVLASLEDTRKGKRQGNGNTNDNYDTSTKKRRTHNRDSQPPSPSHNAQVHCTNSNEREDEASATESRQRQSKTPSCDAGNPTVEDLVTPQASDDELDESSDVEQGALELNLVSTCTAALLTRTRTHDEGLVIPHLCFFWPRT